MLANTGIVQAVAASLRRHDLGAYVLDPVMVATSGDVLLAPDAVASIRDELLPLAAVVTPNWPEAVILTGVEERDLRGMEAEGRDLQGMEAEGRDLRGMETAARDLVGRGAGAALIKGGHLEGDEVVDLFWDGKSRRVFRGPRIDTPHTHGTGCTLSAAIAAGLARGAPLGAAVEEAVTWVRAAIAGAPGLGAGRGPLDHFAEVAITGSTDSISAPRTPPAASP